MMVLYIAFLLTVATVTISVGDSIKMPVESQTCPEDWISLYRNISFESEGVALLICMKYYDGSTWSEAEETCHKGMGKLLDPEHILYTDKTLTKTYNFTSYPEFWTGVYWSSNDVLITSGIPQKIVTSNMFLNAPWESGQPSYDSGKCVAVKRSWEMDKYVYNISLSDCNEQRPFFCTASPILFSSVLGCPDNYTGSYRWPICYTMSGPSFAGNFDQAEQQCKEYGNVMINWEHTKDALLAAADWLSLNTKASGKYYHVGRTIPLPEFCEFYIRNEAGMGGLTIYHCSKIAGVICMRPKIRKSVTQEPVIVRMESIYSDQSILRSKERFSKQPIKCITSRPLTELEGVVFRLNSLPLDPASLPMNISESHQVIQIQVPGDTAYEKFAGKYTCVVLHRLLSTEIVSSDSIYVKYVGLYVRSTAKFIYGREKLRKKEKPDTEYVIYRGSVNLTQSVPKDENLLTFNLGLGIKSDLIRVLFNSLTDNLQFSLSGLQNEDYEVRKLDVWKSHAQQVSKIRGEGRTFEFSVFITLKENNTWFNLQNDQFLMTRFIKMLKLFMTVKRVNPETGYNFDPETIVVRSTGSCPAVEIFNKELDTKLQFPASRPQETVKSSETCITDRNPLATAKCSGSFETGYELTEIEINRKCVKDKEESKATTELKKLSNTDLTPNNTKNITAKTANLTSGDNLTSTDVIYTAAILDHVAQAPAVDSETLEDVATIVDNINRQAEDVIYSAQKDGSASNRIVESLEVVASKLTLQQGESKRVLRPAFVVDVRDISSPSDVVVGMQLDESETTAIKNESVKLLENENGLVTRDTDAAIVLPIALIKGNNRTKLSLFIYGSVKLFQDTRDGAKLQVNGKVAAVTLNVDGKAVTDLGDENVKTVYKPNRVDRNLTCGYWNYALDDNAGGWATDGCQLLESENGRSICVCNHLTNFAILIDTGGALDPDHDKALSIISIIGLTLSIIGLSLTVASFILFKPLRKGRGQQTLFNLALVMLISWIIFLAGIKATSSYGGCITVAVLIHYLILVTFMWMLIEGFLQYLRFIKVLGTYIPRFMLKAEIVAWGVPLIPVIIVLAVDYNLYYGGNRYCWMATTALYYAFLLPVGLIILVNIIVFGLVIYNLLNRPKGLQTNQSEHKRLMMNFWAAVSVLFLLGLTWIFGFFAISEARNAFLYLFTIFNSLQGFFIFILFTFRDPQVRKHWKKKFFRKQKAKHIPIDSSIPTRKTSTSSLSTHVSGYRDSTASDISTTSLDYEKVLL